ncbi:hypothetical protein HMI54_001913 [Coelomomyces lativittatus]|nr:hypothetical protein HMI55_003680 [Coelomomyces lativittatus]KAJ1503140.1 hypothetical protein HMI56_002299 [Coelomomyces lativittatus]KAJ1518224.1 hypothetical protein HMI54_001913 [Coelomomyces lativittatus]
MADFFNFMRSTEKKGTTSSTTSSSSASNSPPSTSKTASPQESRLDTTTFPAAGSQQRTPTNSSSSSSVQKKEPLKPNHSPLDWGKLKSSSTNLKGSYVPNMKLSLTEVAKHNKEEDAWTVIRGKVYNITPYFSYHPGGVAQLKRAAGVDATKLFTSIHAWVNVDFLLDKCLLGPLTNE